MIKDPEIAKHLIVSTIHISPNDVRLLGDEKATNLLLVADEYPYGYRVYCFNKSQYTLTIRSELYTRGFSKEFIRILRVANKLGCTRIDFDQDGPVYDELFQFEW
jgi:hypothetical protein